MVRHLIVIVFLFVTGLASAQKYSNEELMALEYDSLISLYESYVDFYDRNISDSITARRIAYGYISKAWAENDSSKVARGYERLSNVSDYHDAIKFLDTAIAVSYNSNHPNYPTTPLLFKSYYLNLIQEYEAALESAIEAYHFGVKKENINHQMTALNYISLSHSRWGDYSKALATEKQSLNLLLMDTSNQFFQANYIQSLGDIGVCYLRLNKPDSAAAYFKIAIDESKNLEIPSTFQNYYSYVAKYGAALYYLGEFEEAMDSIEVSVSRDSSSMSSFMYNYYMGNINYEMKDVDRGIKYLMVADSISSAENELYPELTQLYKRLISHFSTTRHEDKQLYYLDRLLEVDSLLDTRRSSIKLSTENQYVIPRIMNEQKAIISHLETQNERSNKAIIWIASIGFLGIVGLGYYYHLQRKYRARFEQLISEKMEFDTQSCNNRFIRASLPNDILEKILEGLDNFELSKGFLNSNLNSQVLAKSIGTNTNYLSQVINGVKKKNLAKYLKDLRIEYAFNELKNNSMFRKFTIKAIANECGFRSAESFSKAFYKRYGIYPSYYIKQLTKEEDSPE